jgi:hypothetical protein
MFNRRSRLLFILVVVTISISSFAQSNYGAVRGIVTDAIEGTLSNAVVTLTSEATKISRTTVTNGSGEYVFNAVEPGKYSLSATMRGFKIEQSTSLVVDAGNTIPLDFKLQIGSNTETVEVSATEELVNNGTSYNGQLIDSQ